MGKWMGALALVALLAACSGAEPGGAANLPAENPAPAQAGAPEGSPEPPKPAGEPQPEAEEPEEEPFPQGGAVVIEAPVEPGGEPFRFTFTYYYNEELAPALVIDSWWLDEGEDPLDPYYAFWFKGEGWQVDVAVEAAGELLQELSFADTGMFGPHPDAWYITDFNFDGCRDILCLYDVAGAQAVHRYKGWVWNPGERRFDQVNLEDVMSLAIDREDEVLRATSRNSAASRTYWLFRLRDGEFVMTDELTVEQGYLARDPETWEVMENNLDGWSYREYQIVEGERVRVFAEFIPDPEEMERRMTERYYGEDSIWFPPREENPFYMSDFGGGYTGHRERHRMDVEE